MSPVAGAVLIAFNNSSSKRFDAAVSRRSIEWIKCCQHAVLDRSMFERGEISTEEYIPTKYHALPEECGRARTIAKDAEKESVHHTLMPCRNRNLKENCQRMIKNCAGTPLPSPATHLSLLIRILHPRQGLQAPFSNRTAIPEDNRRNQILRLINKFSKNPNTSSNSSSSSI